MVEYARERNVRGFKAEVLTDNRAMLRVLQRGEHDTRVTTSDGIQQSANLFASEPAD
jgi:hypothetical protein